MNSTDLKVIADILAEMRQRWPGGLSEANVANVNSFLGYRLRQRVAKFDRRRFLNHILRREHNEND